MTIAESERHFGINKADFALLNAVWLQDWHVGLLTCGPAMTEIAAPWHDLDNKELILRFFRLWHGGLIECMKDESTLISPDIELVRVSLSSSDENPVPRPISMYQLTTAGGALWDLLVKPDWTQFIRSTHLGHNKHYFGGGDRSRVELLRKCRPDFPAVPGTGTWHELRPWQATYWKVLPVGYEYRFETDDDHDLPYPDDLDASACEKLRGTWHSWHKSFKEVCEEYFSDS